MDTVSNLIRSVLVISKLQSEKMFLISRNREIAKKYQFTCFSGKSVIFILILITINNCLTTNFVTFFSSKHCFDACLAIEISKSNRNDHYLYVKPVSRNSMVTSLSIRGLFIHECKISLKGQISSQNVSFCLPIQYSRSKIAGLIYCE